METSEREALPEPKAKILLKIWQLKAVGERQARLQEVKGDLPPDIRGECESYVQNLVKKMLVKVDGKHGERYISITSIGVALLRQLKELELRKFID